RQSNRTSAKELTEFLCKLSPELKKRPILFYAHSMGGLVLKSWLKHEYRDRKLCPATQITVVDALGRIDGLRILERLWPLRPWPMNTMWQEGVRPKLKVGSREEQESSSLCL
ncbi:MAG: hypothetical protein ABWY66_08815, partial [Xanthobacteraceae bacterium]